MSFEKDIKEFTITRDNLMATGQALHICGLPNVADKFFKAAINLTNCISLMKAIDEL